MERLKRRADFLAAAAGLRAEAGPFRLQARDRRDREFPRVGFTVTKKIGSAVERNRIRRRLRAAAQAILPKSGRTGFDYVLVARRGALTAPFDSILTEMQHALARLHGARQSGGRTARVGIRRARAGDGEAHG
jgi:ribonuclease P protein component